METENKPLDINEKTLKAIRSLRDDNPLRVQAEKVLADPTVSIGDLEPILQAFGHASRVWILFMIFVLSRESFQ